MKKTITLIVLLFFVKVSPAPAWWSETVFQITNSTHRNLTGSVRERLNAAEYPDINKFGFSISNWTSGGKDDKRAHNPGSETIPEEQLDPLLHDGPVGIWWNRVLNRYKNFNFNSGDWSAYYYVALMMHLIENQSVPAHT